MTLVDRAVLETIAYFGQFRRALNINEIHSLLWQLETDKSSIEKSVDKHIRDDILVRDEDLISISSPAIYTTRKRQNLLEIRRKTALCIAGVLQKVPGIRSAILMNSLAMQTADKGSDIDFLIITEPGHLYLSRSIAVPLIDLKGLNKSKNYQAGMACLGYWLSANNLSVKKYQTELHTAAYWIATMVPLFGFEYYREFVAENNWVKSDLPNWREHEVAHLPEKETGVMSQGSRTAKILAGIEYLAYMISRYKIMLQSEFRKSPEMVCSPDTLKLHNYDRRPTYGLKMQSILDILLSKR